MKTPTPEQLQKDTVAMFTAMAKEGGGPASAMQIQYGTGASGEPFVWFSMGLTKREEFASRFMAALIANGDVPANHLDVADVAIAYADALLQRLKK